MNKYFKLMGIAFCIQFLNLGHIVEIILGNIPNLSECLLGFDFIYILFNLDNFDAYLMILKKIISVFASLLAVAFLENHGMYKPESTKSYGYMTYVSLVIVVNLLAYQFLIGNPLRIAEFTSNSFDYCIDGFKMIR